MRAVMLIAFGLFCGCGGDDLVATAVDAAAPLDLAVADKTAACASTFGQSLTNAFARADGTVLAVLPPGEKRCAQPNSTHVVLEMTMKGAAYRMVVDVLSNQGSPDVLFTEVDAPLVGGAWSEGWHAGAALDYVTQLGVHSPSFVPFKQSELVAKLSSEIEVGARIAVFATSMDSPSSAHLVHRNKPNADGAIVLRPDSDRPHYLLLRFAEQAF